MFETEHCANKSSSAPRAANTAQAPSSSGDGFLKEDHVSIVGMACLMTLGILLAMALSIPFRSFGYQAFEDPEDPANPLMYIVFIIAFTAVLLFIIKIGKEKIIQYLVLFAMGTTMMYVFLIPYVYMLWYAGIRDINVLSYGALGIAIATAFALVYLLYKFPEWYVVNACGLLVGGGAAAVFGISLAIFPVFILLGVLAVYDAISVYRTKHMVKLADSAVEMKLPILLVVPKTKDYSFRKQKRLSEHIKTGEKRMAMFIGLGDIVIPGVLVVSSLMFLPLASAMSSNVGPLVVAYGTLAGALFGFSVLMRYVMTGRPQAGLPLLNSGAISGFMITYYIVYQDLQFGMNFNW